MIKVGIDFGTTYTYIYSIDETTGEVKDYRNSPVFESGATGIPTVIVKEKDKDYKTIGYKIGAEVEDEIKGRRFLKKELRSIYHVEDDSDEGDTVNPSASEVNENVELAAVFFSELFFRLGIDLSKVDAIVCGMPENTDLNLSAKDNEGTDRPTYHKTMKEIFEKVCGNESEHIKIDIISEPVLAFIAAQKKGLIEDDGNVLIVDVGGGTNDLAFITCEDGEAKVRAAHGGKGPAGRMFDITMRDVFVNFLRREGFLVKDQYNKKLLNRIKKAKEEIFADGENYGNYPISYPFNTEDPGNGRVQKRFRLTWRDPETEAKQLQLGKTADADKIEDEQEVNFCTAYIEDYEGEDKRSLDTKFKEVADVIWKFVDKKLIGKDIGYSDIHKVLFVGGCSRIYPLTNKIKEELNAHLCEKGVTEAYLPTYINIEGAAERHDSDNPNEEVTLNNSNAVAYGALYFKEENIQWDDDVKLPIGWQFKFGRRDVGNHAIDLDYNAIRAFSGGHRSLLSILIDIENPCGKTTTKGTKIKHYDMTIKFLEPENSNKCRTFYSLENNTVRSEIMILDTGAYLRFNIRNKNKTQIPPRGHYSIPLGPIRIDENTEKEKAKEEHWIRMVAVNTRHDEFYFMFFVDIGNSDFESIKKVDLNKTYIYGISMNADRNTGGRLFANSIRDRENFISRYENGEL